VTGDQKMSGGAVTDDARHAADLVPTPSVAGTAYVSVIIPVRDDAEGLARCLTGLEQQHYPSDAFEVIVVDNGSAARPDDVVDRFPRVRLTVEPRVGSYAARNRGVSLAKGEVLAFTDADCVPQQAWLIEGVRCLHSEADIGLVAGAIEVLLTDPRRPSAVELWELLHGFPQQRYVDEHHFGATANVLCRRSVLDAVGGFDDRLASGGDKEWGRRVHAAGFRIVYAPSAAVAHPPRTSWSAYHRKLVRVFDGELDSRANRGEDAAEVGRPSWRSLTPPLGTIRRHWADPRLIGSSQRCKYALAAFGAKYLGVWVGMRARRRAARIS
jgi:cellulose synthase/poly-beta-1,6-N-acetylglucosamine synthase-like glycosyltransferase